MYHVHPQFYNSHMQATATALGLAVYDDEEVVYASMVGHPNAVQSLWASAVQRNSGFWVSALSGLYSRMHLLAEPGVSRRKLIARIPNSSYVHGVFVADSPNIIVVADPRAATLTASDAVTLKKRRELLEDHLDEFYSAFIAALAAMPTVEIPLLPEWGKPLFTALENGGYISRYSAEMPVLEYETFGDCLLAIRLNPEADWSNAILKLLNRGDLQF